LFGANKQTQRMQKPIIGITSRPFTVTASIGERTVHGMIADYCDGVLDAGGIPVMVPQQNPEHVPAAMRLLDGLVFTGGGDINPTRYGHREDTDTRITRGVDDQRDNWELALARAAQDQRIPTLAICRGAQLVNVAFGGTLWVDLASQYHHSEDHDITDDRAFDGYQSVTVEPGSKLGQIIGSETVVNSIHHQAVKTIAPGFCAVAWANDGVIEAIEPIDSAWDLTAVQWHPEYLQNGKTLFQWVVEAASGRSGRQ